MAKKETAPADVSETTTHDFSYIRVNKGSQQIDVAWPSDSAKALGVVACKNGHPNIPDPTTGEISCGCGSTEVVS
jgi:hypothetical protein